MVQRMEQDMYSKLSKANRVIKLAWAQHLICIATIVLK